MSCTQNENVSIDPVKVSEYIIIISVKHDSGWKVEFLRKYHNCVNFVVCLFVLKVKHLFPKWDVEMKMIQLKQNTAQTIDTMWNYARDASE